MVNSISFYFSIAWSSFSSGSGINIISIYLYNILSKLFDAIFEIIKLNLKNLFKNRFILIILVYDSIMTVLSLFGKSNHFLYQYLILVPVIGQTLRFYLDSFILKFSEEHNRNNTLKLLEDKI